MIFDFDFFFVIFDSDSRFDLPAIAEKKRLISEKIRQDEEHINLVREGLKKSTELSHGMVKKKTKKTTQIYLTFFFQLTVLYISFFPPLLYNSPDGATQLF